MENFKNSFIFKIVLVTLFISLGLSFLHYNIVANNRNSINSLIEKIESSPNSASYTEEIKEIKENSHSNLYFISFEFLSLLIISTLAIFAFIYFNRIEMQKIKLGQRFRVDKERDSKEQILLYKNQISQTEELVSIITHQLKQPLYSIMLISTAIKDDYEYNELTLEKLESETEKIYTQIDFLSNTVTDFKNFFKQSNVKKPFNIKNSIEEISKLLSIQLKKFNIKIDIQGKEYFVDGYENEFKHVILNMINNAKDSILDKKVKEGLIKIKIVETDKKTVINIEDNGGGIDNSILPDKIFKYYTTTKGDKGTGIGLALSKKIIEKMEGKIFAYNIKSGAKFTIELPSTSLKES